MLNVAPIMNWVERHGSALIQNRLGPNRVGPFGLFQTIADALKFLFKEDVVPAQANKWLYTMAPAFGLLPAMTTIAVVPFGRAFRLPSGRLFEPIVCDVNVGILVIFALASLSVYGVTMAGWSSANKFSLFGAIRASAQMISYELSLTLAAVSALMVAGSLRLTDVVWRQTGYFVLFDRVKIPAWNVLSPAMWLSFVVFSVSAVAQTNRLALAVAWSGGGLVAAVHPE